MITIRFDVQNGSATATAAFDFNFKSSAIDRSRSTVGLPFGI
jgi:hypothetical protein